MLKTATLGAAALAATVGIASAGSTAALTKDRVTQLQTAWGEGIVEIGKIYKNGGDYKAAARKHIENFYAYGDETVLFKPTLASKEQFRGTLDGALSYFVGGSVAEDHGFAIAPYTDVRWETEGMVFNGDMALSMGNYYFTKTDGTEVKAEYSFGIEQMDDGKLKIVLHHSSLPFSPK